VSGQISEKSVVEGACRQSGPPPSGLGRRGFWPVLALLLLALTLGGCLEKRKVVYMPRQGEVVATADGPGEGCPLPGQRLAGAAPDATVSLLKAHFDGWRGIPYRSGGLSRQGIDCSGFVQLTYRDLFGKELPRTVREQVETGREVPIRAVQPGDLIFFKTGGRQRHVGIYVEEDLFLHASLSSGVTLSSLREPYWQGRYWLSKRL
jgi:probable lipoprotein NlpC